MIDISHYSDRDYGLLLPAAVTLMALAANDNQVRRLRPQLKEDQDYLRQVDHNNIERIFYTLSGLAKLTHLLPQTPQSAELQEQLASFLNASADLVPAPAPAQPVTWSRSAFPTATLPNASMPGQIEPNHPARLVAGLVAEQVGGKLGQVIAAQQGTLQSHADLLLQQQQMTLQAVETGARTVLVAQQQTDGLRPDIHIQTNETIEGADSTKRGGLNSQDPLAFAGVAICFTLFAIGLGCVLGRINSTPSLNYSDSPVNQTLQNQGGR